jgi:YVTN family beta-propeller protein
MGRGGALVVIAAVTLAAPAAAGRAPVAPAAPTVTGPRTTTSTRPAYRFAAARAVRFRCAFDTPKLHACAARYSQRLAVGAHVLRVRAVGRTGKTSRITSVRVRVEQATPAPPTVPLAATVKVGSGAGAPTVGAGSVWVPNTVDGTLSRVDPATNTVTATIKYSTGGLPGDFYDSAAFGHGSVWVASDEHATVTRVDPATNAVVATIPVASRPAQITVTSDAVWLGHFLQPIATRIDPTTNAAVQKQVGAPLTGAAGDGSTVWLLANQPQTLLHLASGGSELAHGDVTPSTTQTRSFLAAWWVAVSDGAVWVTHPNQNCVTRTDPAAAAVTATVPITAGRLFGVAAARGIVWAVTDSALVRIDLATNAVTGTAPFPKAAQAGFTGVAIGDSAVWATNYDRGELYRVAA